MRYHEFITEAKTNLLEFKLQRKGSKGPAVKEMQKMLRKKVNKHEDWLPAIKVYGEGEWKVKVQGKTKRRKWIKLHAGIDERTQEVIVLEVTPGNVADCKAGKKVIEKLPKSMRMLKADTGYDTRNIRNLIRKKGAKSLIPPRKNAVKKGEDEERDDALCEMRGFGRDRIGRSLWGKITGYSYRTLVESCFSRFKRLFSASFFSRGMVRQTVEGNLKC